MQLSSVLNKVFAPVSKAQLRSELQTLSSEELNCIGGGDFPPIDSINVPVVLPIQIWEDC